MPRTRSLAWAELKIGIITIAAIAIAGMLVFMLGGQGGFYWQRYHLKSRFPNVYGLKSGALVRVSGVEVGKVGLVELTGSDVEVVVEINKAYRDRITTNSRATIGSLGLLGDSTVEVTASLEGTPIPEWGYIQSTKVASFSDVAQTASEGVTEATKLLQEMRQGRGTLGKLVSDDALYRDLREFIASAEGVTTTLSKGQGTLGRLMQDPRAAKSLEAALDDLAKVTARLNSGEGSLGRLLKDDAFAQSLTATTANLNDLTTKLKNGEGTAGKLFTDKALYEKLESVTSRLDQMTSRLNAGEGTVGRLLQDQQLYDNMNGAVTEMRNLLGEIRKDPKKYLSVKVSIW